MPQYAEAYDLFKSGRKTVGFAGLKVNICQHARAASPSRLFPMARENRRLDIRFYQVLPRSGASGLLSCSSRGWPPEP